MQAPHRIEYFVAGKRVCCPGELLFNAKLDEPSHRKRHNAGEDLTSDLAIRPMMKRSHADVMRVLAGSKLGLDEDSIKRELDNIGGSPVMVVGHDDVATKQCLASANGCIVFSKAHLRSTAPVSELKPIALAFDMQLGAKLLVSFFNSLGILPLRLRFSVILAELKQFFPYRSQLGFHCESFLSRQQRIVGHNNRTLLAPQSDFGAKRAHLIGGAASIDVGPGLDRLKLA